MQVAIRSRSTDEPLATGFVTGGSMGEMGPFESTLGVRRAHHPTTAPWSSAVLSMEDGRVWEAAVVQVSFADPGN